jgi:hypothetical protein
VQPHFERIVGVDEPVGHRGVQRAHHQLGQEVGGEVAAHLSPLLAVSQHPAERLVDAHQVGIRLPGTRARPHELENDVPGQGASAGQLAGHALGEALDALGHRNRPRELLVQHPLQVHRDLAADLCEHRLLAGEVVEEGALGHVGCAGDLGDGGGLEAALQEELTRGLVDARAKLALLALAASLDCHLGHQRRTLLQEHSISIKHTIYLKPAIDIFSIPIST